MNGSRLSHQPLKVLHVVRTGDPRAGGFVSYIDSMRAGLAGRPVTLHTEAVFPAEQRGRVLAVRAPLRFARCTRQRLPQMDLLHVHGIFGWHVLLGVWAAMRARRPYVLTLHGHLHEEALRERRLSKRIYLALVGRRILRRAAAVLVTAPVEAEIVARHVPHARVRELVPGLEIPPAEAPPPHAVPGPMQLLYIGRLHPHKGLPLLLRALAAARERGLDAQLQVAGPGHAHHHRRVVRAIKALGLRECVTLLGHVDAQQRDRLLQQSALLVLPSRSENFGFVVAEAMAAARPVIVSQGVGLAHLVSRWRCGTVVPIGAVDALCDALLAYADPILRHDHGRRARQAACEEFSLSRMGHDAEVIYRQAVALSAPESAR